jgi:ABC-2 type transport system permease protein
MRGSWFTLLFSTLLFAVGALGTGLLVSTLVESQVVAFQVVLLLAFLPTFILSGFVFPISSMPVPIQVVTHIVPARYFLVALRGIVLKGVGITTIWPQLVAMVIYLLVTLGLASVRLAKARG